MSTKKQDVIRARAVQFKYQLSDENSQDFILSYSTYQIWKLYHDHYYVLFNYFIAFVHLLFCEDSVVYFDQMKNSLSDAAAIAIVPALQIRPMQ